MLSAPESGCPFPLMLIRFYFSGETKVIYLKLLAISYKKERSDLIKKAGLLWQNRNKLQIIIRRSVKETRPQKVKD
jgi:hypothetical protein